MDGENAKYAESDGEYDAAEAHADDAPLTHAVEETAAAKKFNYRRIHLCEIDDSTGVLSFNGKNPMEVGVFMGECPLSPQHSTFEIEILSDGLNEIGLGFTPSDYPDNKMPGWYKGSVAYHADDGGLPCSEVTTS